LVYTRDSKSLKMHITIIIILTYIACCLRVGAAPWKFFQLNARYFSNDQGIFSKLSIDALIPERWRLFQIPDDGMVSPESYPVFVKPEWGQNALGIQRANNFQELQKIRQSLHQQDSEKKYILQEAAPGAREFEIFSIDVSKHDGQHDVVTVTEAVNETEDFPINSKYNLNTRYVDISNHFSNSDLNLLAQYLDNVGDFAISRMSVRADTLEELIAGKFHVIEVNLFLPMPINLLDNTFSWSMRLKFIGRAMMSLALATKAIKPVDKPPAIFTRMMLYGRQKRTPMRSLNKLTSARRTFL